MSQDDKPDDERPDDPRADARPAMTPMTLPLGLLRKASELIGRDDMAVDPAFRHASLRMLGRAERVMERLDGVALTLQKVAELELHLVQKLVPIVEDLGELVRHSLDEARERRGVGPRRPGSPPPVIIEHEPED